MVGRAVLAVGESGNFPAAIKTIAEWFPQRERSFATGIFNSGANIGAILAPLCVPWMAAHLGWESTFIMVGGVGFLWLIFWFLWYDSPVRQAQKGRLSQSEFSYINGGNERETKETTPDSPPQKKISWFKLLAYRQTWSFTFGKFITDGVWWFFLFWLPAYLKARYGIKGTATMLPLTVLYSMTMIGSISGGWFPNFFIKRGMENYQARLTAMLSIAVIPLLVLLAQPLGVYSYWFPIIIIGIGASAHQAWSANLFTTVSDMFPKKTIASVIGIGGMAGGIGGVIVSKVGGWMFDYYQGKGHVEKGYTIMFAFCAIAYLFAWTVMKLLVPRFKRVEL
jgi:ACS family hexuronate transporter-like MFS transporter